MSTPDGWVFNSKASFKRSSAWGVNDVRRLRFFVFKSVTRSCRLVGPFFSLQRQRWSRQRSERQQWSRTDHHISTLLRASISRARVWSSKHSWGWYPVSQTGRWLIGCRRAHASHSTLGQLEFELDPVLDDAAWMLSRSVWFLPDWCHRSSLASF